MNRFSTRALAATATALAAAAPLHAAAPKFTYVPKSGEGTQTLYIADYPEPTVNRSRDGLGTLADSAGDTHGSATSAADQGSASALLYEGAAPGGLTLPGPGGTANGDVYAQLDYMYVFTARNPGEVFSIVSNPTYHAASCGSPTPTSGPCYVTPLGTQPTYVIQSATTITGDYHTETSGFATASVFALGSGSPPSGGFSLECGFARTPVATCDGFNSRGTFSTVGVLAVDDASLAANAFYGFISISADANIREGGYASAFIDPRVVFSLTGVDPNDFTLTLSPGFTNGAPAATGVPEPASWALMILGFGAIGAVARRRSRDLAMGTVA